MHQSDQEMISIAFESDPLAVRTALSDLISGLRPLSLDGEELGTVELVLAEALNNVVEHAYPEGEPAGPVNITCRTSEKGLLFRVMDKGRPMPGEALPETKLANVNVDLYDLPEGGFGWFLIKDLAKDVTYSRADGHNILDLRVAVTVSDAS